MTRCAGWVAGVAHPLPTLRVGAVPGMLESSDAGDAGMGMLVKLARISGSWWGCRPLSRAMSMVFPCFLKVGQRSISSPSLGIFGSGLDCVRVAQGMLRRSFLRINARQRYWVALAFRARRSTAQLDCCFCGCCCCYCHSCRCCSWCCCCSQTQVPTHQMTRS